MRFDAEGYGYRPGDGLVPQDLMYTLMEQNAAFASGWSSADPNVYVNTGAFADSPSTATLAGRVLHEEVHQRGEDGPYHNTGTATTLQNRCS